MYSLKIVLRPRGGLQTRSRLAVCVSLCTQAGCPATTTAAAFWPTGNAWERPFHLGLSTLHLGLSTLHFYWWLLLLHALIQPSATVVMPVRPTGLTYSLKPYSYRPQARRNGAPIDTPPIEDLVAPRPNGTTYVRTQHSLVPGIEHQSFVTEHGPAAKSQYLAIPAENELLFINCSVDSTDAEFNYDHLRPEEEESDLEGEDTDDDEEVDEVCDLHMP
jgi:hypothetical protein